MHGEETADGRFGVRSSFLVAGRASGWEDGATANLGLLGDVPEALERLNVPLFLLDRDGVVVWVNAAGRRLAGDATGRRYAQWVAPESRDTVARQFSRKVLGVSESSDYEAVMQTQDGSRFNAEISSVSLDEDGQVVGVFGVITPLHEPTPPPAAATLTPRQAQVLRLLAHGASTQLIAEELGLSPETVRNHIRALFRRLGVHSRLEAVVAGHARGLLQRDDGHSDLDA